MLIVDWERVTGVWESGELTLDEQACYVDVDMEHPDYMFWRLGVEPPPDLEFDVTHGHSIAMEFMNCLGPEGKLRLLARLNTGMRSLGEARGADIAAALGQSEQFCLSQTFSQEERAALLDARFTTFPDVVDALCDCAPEDLGEVYELFATGAVEGGLNEKAASCSSDFVDEHAPYIARMGSPASDLDEALPLETELHFALDTAKLVQCFNKDPAMSTAMNEAFADPLFQ